MFDKNGLSIHNPSNTISFYSKTKPFTLIGHSQLNFL